MSEHERFYRETIEFIDRNRLELQLGEASRALRLSKNHGCAAYSLLGIDRCERKTDAAVANLSPIVTTSTR
jgi:hypothetical protein